MWVGLTGRNCSGKDTVAAAFAQHGYILISLSDMLRNELVQNGIELTRPNIHNLARQLRDKDGAACLMKRAMQEAGENKNVVFFSIRHPDEVRQLKQSDPHCLIDVQADDTIRFQRNLARKRDKAPKTYGEFIKEEEIETEKADKRYFDIIGCQKLADVKVTNNGTKDEVAAQVDNILKMYTPD